jgi:predicted kinase
MPAVTKTIYVLIGLPFAGKTTVAASLATHDALLIERDRFLEAVQREPETVNRLRMEAAAIAEPISRFDQTIKENAYNDCLTREYVRRVTSLIQNSKAQRVVVDGTHLQPLSRSFIAAFPNAKRIAVLIQTPVEACIARLQSSPVPTGIRASVTPELIRRLSHVYEPPTLAEGFDKIELYTRPD